MTLFWILAAAAALVVAALLGLALLRGRSGPLTSGDFDMKVYRDQLREIERDAARGTIAPEEAERLRTEIARRILAADARGETTADTPSRGAPSLVMIALIALVLTGGSLWLYTSLGAPGYGDLGLKDRIAAAETFRQNRPAQAEAEAQVPQQPQPELPQDYMELVTRLRTAVETRPDDIQGHALLARSEAALGNYRAAYEAQSALLDLKGDAASATEWADLVDMMVLAAGGYVSPEAERALEQVMRRDEDNGVGRYYGGLMMAQTGRPDAAFRIWDRLLRDSAATDPWVGAVREQIPDLAFAAGIDDYQLPEGAAPALAGPSREDVEAAADLSDEDRADMVRGMVDRLGARLATDGGSPQEWAQLISALGVLNETDHAREIWTEAQEIFADSPEALAPIRAAAETAGVTR
ncbi:c-type cytochrome biogenesis protein CcmI [Salipiger pallidus]|uniref:C-type cytochrome biogenesis protein CcmI n=1 Tax=Salipiger pallidus TaxID=1775170 RepID=A0A8J3EHD7_9RHOB|nr:c-type cytochrome biogenesis protein CcmI [Salipiger pallidus]GGG82683.1 c-type cytochrome biogenesis protein CcmI [Salipiger pallidus]